MTVDEAWEFFSDPDRADGPARARDAPQVGVGYLRLGQPATELSGGEAQRIKLATELQRTARGDTLYVLDEPTTGLHPVDVEQLVVQLNGLVDAGNTVVVVEHDMSVAARSDWVIDMGPGAGEEGGGSWPHGYPRQDSRWRSDARYPRSQGNTFARGRIRPFERWDLGLGSADLRAYPTSGGGVRRSRPR